MHDKHKCTNYELLSTGDSQHNTTYGERISGKHGPAVGGCRLYANQVQNGGQDRPYRWAASSPLQMFFRVTFRTCDQNILRYSSNSWLCFQLWNKNPVRVGKLTDKVDICLQTIDWTGLFINRENESPLLICLLECCDYNETRCPSVIIFPNKLSKLT